MKRILLFLLISVFLTACNNDDTLLEIEVSQTKCILDNTNRYIELDITNVSGEYTLNTSNNNIVKLIKSESNNNQFYIIALNPGNTTVTITDKNNRSASIDVTVSDELSELIATNETVFIKVGEKKELYYPKNIILNLISTRHSTIVSSEIGDEANKKINIKGLKIGETQVSILDIIGVRHVFDVKVVDTYDIILNREDAFLDYYNKDYYFHILCGNGEYEVTSSDETQGKCEVIEYTGDKTLGILSNPASIKVKEMEGGANFDIRIKDKEGKTKTINISTGFLIQH